MDEFIFLGGAYKQNHAICSDNNCPCPQVYIPRGQGYIYVEEYNGIFRGNLTCEQGAKLRNLDLQIAQNDAKRWWETGMIPKRVTPQSKIKHTVSDKPEIPDYIKDYREKRIRELEDLLSYEYLFFDTETTGLPKNYNAPTSDLNNWPRLVQISWLEYDINQKIINERNFIIKPNGFVIPNDSIRIHGITNEKALKEGVELSVALRKFSDYARHAKTIIGHNLEYDENIVGAEFIRSGIKNTLNGKTKICTMKSSTNYCAIRNSYGFKYPTLDELHKKLFNTNFEGAHNSLNDVRATAKCFWELKKKGII